MANQQQDQGQNQKPGQSEQDDPTKKQQQQEEERRRQQQGGQDLPGQGGKQDQHKGGQR